MKQFKTGLLIFIVVIFIVFAVQNFEDVNIVLFKWGIKLPLAFSMVAVYVLGMFTGGLFWSNLKKLAKHDEDPKSKNDRENL